MSSGLFQRLVWPISSGFLAATASAIGKLAFSDYIGELSSNVYIVYALRASVFAGMLGTNAMMVACFARGLKEAGSIAGSSVSTASNFCTAALYGLVLYGEQPHGTGLLFVLAGTILITIGQREEKDIKPD